MPSVYGLSVVARGGIWWPVVGFGGPWWGLVVRSEVRWGVCGS